MRATEIKMVRGAGNGFKIKLTGDIDKVKDLGVDLNDGVQLMLTDVGLLVSNSASKNAPYLSGTLRRSITMDFDKIQKGFVIVGSDVKYAKRREYENNKNPDRRYYLLRGYTENRNKISAIVVNALTKKLK